MKRLESAEQKRKWSASFSVSHTFTLEQCQNVCNNRNRYNLCVVRSAHFSSHNDSTRTNPVYSWYIYWRVVKAIRIAHSDKNGEEMRIEWKERTVKGNIEIVIIQRVPFNSEIFIWPAIVALL